MLKREVSVRVPAASGIFSVYYLSVCFERIAGAGPWKGLRGEVAQGPHADHLESLARRATEPQKVSD